MTAAAPIDVLKVRASFNAYCWWTYRLEMDEAVDPLQAYAEASGLIDELGQDEVQRLIAAPFAFLRAVSAAEEAKQQRADQAAEDEVLRRQDDGDLVTAWELADPRDAWRHTGEAPPPVTIRNSDISGERVDRPRRGSHQATIDALNYVAGLGDPEHLAKWLRDHPEVARELAKEAA